MELVTELRSSGSGLPRANFAATYARGYPVAFDAKAELRDNLAFTSMIKYCKKELDQTMSRQLMSRK